MEKPIASEPSILALAIADTSLKLTEARAQIDELVEANQRLRGDLSELTLMWSEARAKR